MVVYKTKPHDAYEYTVTCTRNRADIIKKKINQVQNNKRIQ